MTELSEAAKAKASELWQRGSDAGWTPSDTLACFIQEVSDAAKEATAAVKKDAAEWTPSENTSRIQSLLAPFILPEPVDPLAEVLWGMDLAEVKNGAEKTAELIRQELAKRGLKIVEADHDQ